MQLIKEGNIVAGFSDATDGDLSFYLMTASQIERVWSELPIAKELALETPAFASQIHGDRIVTVAAKSSCCVGDADALITSLVNQPIGVFSADCLPVLMFNEKVCAAVHAGWRGTLLDICGKSVQAFANQYDQAAESLKACIGPCIGQCCLEMGDEIYREFVAANKDYQQFFTRRKKWHLNLRALNRFQLLRAGMKNENIYEKEDCTFCQEKDFFSFRRQKQRNGSMFSFVVNLNAN